MSITERNLCFLQLQHDMPLCAVECWQLSSMQGTVACGLGMGMQRQYEARRMGRKGVSLTLQVHS